jgi:hypothetical protein
MVVLVVTVVVGGGAVTRNVVVGCHVSRCVCEATDSNFVTKAFAVLKQPCIYLDGHKKMTELLINTLGLQLRGNGLTVSLGCPLYQQRNTLRPSTMDMTQTPIGSRNDGGPHTITLYCGAVISGHDSNTYWLEKRWRSSRGPHTLTLYCGAAINENDLNTHRLEKFTAVLTPSRYIVVLSSTLDTSCHRTTIEAVFLALAAMRLPNNPYKPVESAGRHYYLTLPGSIAIRLAMHAGSSSRKHCAGYARSVSLLRLHHCVSRAICTPPLEQSFCVLPTILQSQS